MKPPPSSTQAARTSQQLSRWVKHFSDHWRFNRIHVVNPELCHDALDRLAPSLRAHHRCDLIDVNPGVSLWTRHLHAALKPRRHILVEPELDAFGDFIRPLLQEQGSSYRHVNNLKDAFDKDHGLLSDCNTRQHTSTPTTFNTSLVLNLNLTGAYKPAAREAGTNAKYFLNNLYASLFGLRDQIFQYGLVRVLAWIPDDDKDSIVPRTVCHRTRQSLQLETASSITEVVGGPENRSVRNSNRDHRWYDLDKENSEALLTGQNVQIPDYAVERQHEPLLPPMAAIPADIEQLRAGKYRDSSAFVPDLLKLDEKLKGTEWYQKQSKSPAPKHQNQETDDQKVWRRLMQRVRTGHVQYMDIKQLVNRLRSLEYSLREEHGKDSTSTKVIDLRAEAERLRVRVTTWRPENKTMARKAIDDYRAYDSRPKALAWNKRSADPLIMHAHETAPQKPIALLDIVPDPQFRQQLDTNSKVVCYDYVTMKLCSRWSKDIRSALSGLLQGGVDEFIDTVPSLKDPIQGGWHDISDLRVRSLPAKLIMDIALAFERWAFRPEVEKMQLSMGRDTLKASDELK